MANRATKTKAQTIEAAPLLEQQGAASVPAVQQQGGAVATATADPIFAIIERLAKDPSFDVDKMERLIKMQQSAKADNARAEFDQAMSLAQAEMKAIRTNKANSQTHSRYANYQALDKAIREIYTKHGFAMSFNTGDTERPLEVRVLCTLSHRGGHRQDYKIDVPADGKGPQGGDVMTKTHATGSAASYGQRYLTKLIWNLAVGDDDDGNAASSAAERFKVWTDAAIQELNALEKDKAALDKWYSENEKSLGRLKKNAPEQFERYQIAYKNAAERCGIKAEEPKRGGDKKPKEEKAKPAHEPETVGEVLDGKPLVIDVVDQNEPIEFDDFKTAKEFLDFSSGWIAEPGRTAAQAKQWHERFKPKINEYLQHKFPNTEKSWIRESMTDTFAQYVKITANEQPE